MWLANRCAVNRTRLVADPVARASDEYHTTDRFDRHVASDRRRSKATDDRIKSQRTREYGGRRRGTGRSPRPWVSTTGVQLSTRRGEDGTPTRSPSEVSGRRDHRFQSRRQPRSISWRRSARRIATVSIDAIGIGNCLRYNWPAPSVMARISPVPSTWIVYPAVMNRCVSNSDEPVTS